MDVSVRNKRLGCSGKYICLSAKNDGKGSACHAKALTLHREMKRQEDNYNT